MTREKIRTFLDDPASRAGVTYLYVSVLIIYVSLILLAVEHKGLFQSQTAITMLGYADTAILIFFTIEMLVRLCVYRTPWEYIRRNGGWIDLLAVVPGLVALVIPAAWSFPWVRALRLLRFFRILKFLKGSRNENSFVGGVFLSLLPWLGAAVALKLVAYVYIDGQVDWIPSGSLDMPISVIAFAATVLLGAKLAIAQTRFYSVEEAVCNVVGALRAIRSRKGLTTIADEWAAKLLCELEGQEQSGRRTDSMYTHLAEEAANNGYDDSVLADLAKDYARLLHLVSSQTPPYLDGFMKASAIVFVLFSIFAVPGVLGLITTFFMVMIVGGMYVLIDDLDVPLGRPSLSLINVDITPLRRLVADGTGV